MKLESFKFQDGKVFWLPEYPTRKGCENNCTWNKAYCGDCPDWKELHEKEAQSLASAIEVAPEDTEKVREIIWSYPSNSGMSGEPSLHHAESLSGWQPEKDKVYSAECEMEIKQKCQHKGIHNSTCVYRQMSRLKPSTE